MTPILEKKNSPTLEKKKNLTLWKLCLRHNFSEMNINGTDTPLIHPAPQIPFYTQSQSLLTPTSQHSGIMVSKGSVKKGPEHLRRAGPALAHQVAAWAGTVGTTR